MGERGVNWDLGLGGIPHHGVDHGGQIGFREWRKDIRAKSGDKAKVHPKLDGGGVTGRKIVAGIGRSLVCVDGIK